MSKKQKTYTKRYMKRLRLSYSILKKAIATTVLYEQNEASAPEFFKSLTTEENDVFVYLQLQETNKRLAKKQNGELRGKNDKN